VRHDVGGMTDAKPVYDLFDRTSTVIYCFWRHVLSNHRRLADDVSRFAKRAQSGVGYFFSRNVSTASV
jgi:hypothetical protein